MDGQAKAQKQEKEGVDTTRHDLTDIRFRLHDNEREKLSTENQKRNVWRTITITTATWILLGAANYLQLLELPYFWINIAAGSATAGIIIWAFWRTNKTNKKLSGLWTSRRKLREAEKERRVRLTEDTSGVTQILWHYHSDVASTIDDYRATAGWYRNIHNRIQSITIVLSMLVTAVAALSNQFGELTMVVTVLSLFVAISTGFTGYFKFREKGMNLQRAADELEYEYNSAELAINAYRSIDKEQERLKEFAERSEKIKSDQRKREQQLEQPPESRATSGGEKSSS